MDVSFRRRLILIVVTFSDVNISLPQIFYILFHLIVVNKVSDLVPIYL